MFPTSYIIPWSPRSYIPLSLRHRDIYAICFPMIQMHPQYTVRILIPSIYTGPHFFWEQVSGPIVEISDPNIEKPIIILDDELGGADVVMRVYIDRGTSHELSHEFTIYRTPTSHSAPTYTSESENNHIIAPLAVDGTTYDTSLLARLLSPIDGVMVPSLKANNDTNLVIGFQLAEDLAGYTITWNQPLALLDGFHTYIRTFIYDSNTGNLLGASDNGEFTLSKEYSTVYLVNEVQLYTGISGVPSKRLLAGDGTVIRTAYSDIHNPDYFIGFVASPYAAPRFIKDTSSVLSREKVTVEYTGFIQEDESTPIYHLTDVVGKGVIKNVFSLTSEVYEDESNFEYTTNKPSYSNYSLTRYNGISIGG